jgi:BirA family biotin operon repressor/biotin-[acetyl-CoA-carboxylase] ligase
MTHLEDRKLDRFLQLLLDNATLFVSGEKYARTMKVTRQTINNWVHFLQGQGLAIQVDPHHGYRLRELPDLLLPHLVRRYLHTRVLGRQIYHHYQVGSTNEEALKLAREGKAEGSVVIAEEQLSGRGRLGRSWHSEKNAGIYLSVLCYPDLVPRMAPLLSLLAAVAASRAIERVSGLPTDIKWPNDILVQGRKCCGILLEMQADLDRIRHAVLGIGINVNQRLFPEELQQKATSLFLAAGRRISRLELTACLLHFLEEGLDDLAEKGPAAVVESWTQKSSFAFGKKVVARTGKQEWVGITEGLAEDGSLRLKTQDGSVRQVSSGEIATW